MREVIITLALVLLLGCMGTMEDREMRKIKDVFCDEVLAQADMARQRGDELTPEEKAAVEFCR